MFFSRRKRAAELARQEAAGESLWTAEFREAFRVRLLDAFRQAGRNSDVRELLELAQRQLTVDLGRPHLSKGWSGSQLADIDHYISGELKGGKMQSEFTRPDRRRGVLLEFAHYYNHDRPHRSLRLASLVLTPVTSTGEDGSRPVLGDLHHVYYRAA